MSIRSKGFQMLKSLITLSALAVSTQVFASSQHDFIAVNESVDTQICIVAAKQGFNAARDFAGENGQYISRYNPNFYCNGQRINEFAANFSNVETQAKTVIKQVSLFAADEKHESNICVAAAKDGLSVVKSKTDAKQIKCNGESITEFVKRYENKIAI